MTSLADLPEHRQEALLWFHAPWLDYAGVDDLVAAGDEEPCRRDVGDDLRELVAVLGDDGRYHPRTGTALMWGKNSRRRPDEFRHAQWCHWWTDGTRYRIQPPPGADLSMLMNQVSGLRRYPRWTVRLTDTVLALELVPPSRRCPMGANQLWPPFRNLATTRGRLRARLVAEFGPLCQACGLVWSFAIDHDHFTDLIRGLLCRTCNSHIDRCVHVSGCHLADYANDPPAARLQLTMANRPLSSGELAKIADLGFNPLRPSRGAADQNLRLID